MSLVIAIDGPAGAGKSTIAQKIALKLEFIYFDSGSIYRAFTLYLQEKFGQIDASKDYSKDLEECQKQLDLKFSPGDRRVYLDGKDITGALRSEEITRNINIIANNGIYRGKANYLIRKFAKINNMVIDGRDIGTVIFPDTPFKFYLDASIKTRANRRYEELLEKEKDQKNGIANSLDNIQQDMEKRDNLDKNRDVGPLIQAHDAIYIDSDGLAINEVVQRFLDKIQEIKGNHNL